VYQPLLRYKRRIVAAKKIEEATLGKPVIEKVSVKIQASEK
jgi:hypothetical protein